MLGGFEKADLLFANYLDNVLITYEAEGVPPDVERLEVYRDSFRRVLNEFEREVREDERRLRMEAKNG